MSKQSESSQVDKVVIKPCPFCGGAPITEEESGCMYISCGDDKCLVNCYISIDIKIRDDAIKIWNKRALK